MGCGIMLLRIQPMRIGKVRLRHFKLLCLPIHQPDKARFASTHSVGQCQRRVVAGGQQQAGQQLPYGIAISRFEIHGGALHRTVGGLDGHRFIQSALFQADQGCHQLGRAGDQHPAVRILFIQALTVRGDHNRAFCLYLRRFLRRGRSLRPEEQQRKHTGCESG